MYKNTIVLGLCCIILILPDVSLAAKDYLKISGFLTTAMTYGDNNEVPTVYYNSINTDDFELAAHDNRVGIQLEAEVSSSLRLTTQMLARAPNDDYNFFVNWAYADFKIGNHINAHVGKFRLAQFLVSDYAEIGYAYPWIRPPQDVYSTNPMISLSGIDLFFHQHVGNNYDIILQLYYGDGYHSTYIPPNVYDSLPPENPIRANYAKGEHVQFKSHAYQGVNLGISSDAFTFRVGHLHTLIDVEGLLKDIEGEFTGVGLSFDLYNVIFYGEYVNRDTDKAMESMFPDQVAWYTTLGYRLKSFILHYTYSKLDTGRDLSDFALEQQTNTYGLRYEIAQGAALKFEMMDVLPKEDNYGLFNDIIQDATIYTLGMDFIF